jgi:tagatose-1,6-bisphosphate aldolase
VSSGSPTGAASDVGRQRRLLRLAGPDGVIAGIAIDHRDSLRALLDRRGLSLAQPQLRMLKLALAKALAPSATAIMLDEELGGIALREGAVPSSIGLIMPLEGQGEEAVGDGRITTLLEDFSPSDALRYGADACKLLVPYRADDERSSARQDDVVRSTADACHDVGLPLVVEPVVYRWSTETDAEFADAYADLVLAAAIGLQPLGGDLLKLPFPVLMVDSGDEASASGACRALAAACRETPWVLLGAGVDNETFVDQVRLAGAAGAAGFLVGRGIWGPAVAEDLDEVEYLAATISRPAFERCRQTAEAVARPLTVAASA